MMKGVIALSIIFILVGGNFFAGSTSHDKMSYPLYYEGECKLVMAVGNATAGDYNLLLKVRDPARPGLQVLCHIPRGYEYDYHHPWLPFRMHFRVDRGFIGTTTIDDVPPAIIKPGMMINDAGIAIGDADTISYLTNPSPNAWDDFDWMRYAMQSAGDLDEAVRMLTEDGVKRMHASSVAENFFIINASEGAIVEADAYNYRVREVKNGLEIQSNYPEMLWNIHLIYPVFTASSFNKTFEGWVERGDVIRIGGFMGISISQISSQFIMAHLFPLGIKKKIEVGEGVQIGNFWLELKEVDGKRARVFMCFNYYEWEKKIMDFVRDKVGEIGIRDMMMLSRIHSDDIDGLRGMCQGGYEVATIYKITHAYPQFLSSLWFAPDQCSSIFIPVHMCDMDIYDAYENGESHSIAMKLLERYGHGFLTPIFIEVEREFINETERVEEEAKQLLLEGREEEAIYLLTLSDMKMQMKAMAIEKAWLNISYLGNETFGMVYPVLAKICEKCSCGEEIYNAIDFISSLMKRDDIAKSDKIYLGNIKEILHALLGDKAYFDAHFIPLHET